VGDSRQLDCIDLLGLKVNRLSMTEALSVIRRFIDERTPRHIVTADASMVVLSRDDTDLKRIVQGADLVTPDGAGILWASRLLGKPITHKVSGVDLVDRLCLISHETGIRLYILGGAPSIADTAAAKFREKYPNVQIVGTRHGYFAPGDETSVVQAIMDSKADVLFVAFGIPKQEKFIDRYKEHLGVPVSIGVGGSFDVYSGQVQRAPIWMQNAGLEWIFRLAQNPKKITKVMTLPKFVMIALTARVYGDKATQKQS
jgi:N-acetylglucosaminyldiphosphoundecaprenol N-acetyl-beta-D-mannosaminyltransferase